MNVSSLIDAKATQEEIATYLDGLSHARRMGEVLSLSKKRQKALFAIAGEGPAIDIHHFVPAYVGPRKQVIHYGKNTIPVPRPFQLFEKRFALPEEGPDRLFGYNEGLTRPLIGPGYFVAEETSHREDWVARGQIVVDYFQVPNQPVPEGWPKVIQNNQGLQRFVFHQTRDFMRKVSEHVSVGSAFRDGKEMGFWFVLCRQPLPR